MDGVSVTVLDILVVGVILFSALFAMWRGLIQETLSIVAWVAAAYSALRFYPWLQPLVEDYVASPRLAALAAGAIIFLIVLIPISFLSHRFGENVKQSHIGPVDRSLGFVFGVGRGLVIVGLAYIAFSALVPTRDHPGWLTHARLLPLIQSTSDVLLSLVPDRNGDVVREHWAAKTATDPAKIEPKEKPAKTYGARERRALDRLIEATGDEGSPQ
ncbi:MAG: CvpA family protein [Alphaproteobacteria bacterium]